MLLKCLSPLFKPMDRVDSDPLFVCKSCGAQHHTWDGIKPDCCADCGCSHFNVRPFRKEAVRA